MFSIADVNDLSRKDFAEALKPLFEAAAPLADRLYAQRPFTSYADLIESGSDLSELPTISDVDA